MSIELNPSSQLDFHRPFTQTVKETLTLKNPHKSPVAFKVKTTAPKQYCVRPNSGRIEAGKDVQVQVILQAMREEPPSDFKCRDKFLIQSAIITADQETANLADFWAHIENTAKDSIAERKIRCHYLTDESSNLTNGSTVVSGDVDEFRAGNARSSPPPYTPTSNLKPQRTSESIPKQDNVESTEAQPDQRVEILQNSLQEAKAQIALLTNELKVTRTKLKVAEDKVAETKSNGPTGLVGQRVHVSPEGVPVQWAAALCLLVLSISFGLH